MAKKRHSRRKSGLFGGSNLMGTALGVGGYILFEAFGEKYIPLNGSALNIAELAAGVYFSRKGGIIGNVAKAAIVINAYQLLQGAMGGITGRAQASSSVFN